MSIERTVAGTIATAFTISMKLPQIYHSIKTKRTKDVSMLFLLLGVLNHITWVLYAYFDDVNVPLIVCDADEVIFDFMNSFETYLHTKGLYFNWKSYALEGKILNDKNQALSKNQITDIIHNFFIWFMCSAYN